jgi:lipoprotein-releasing system permease protein
MKLMNMEKWLAYAIVSLTILLIAFNMVGTLWLMVLEKQPDIAILRSMGAPDSLVRRIFLSEGLILCLIGLGVGSFLAILLYQIHQYVDGGLIKIAGGIIDKYPVAMRLGDFPVVALTVLFIGGVAALPAAFRAQRVVPIIKQD